MKIFKDIKVWKKAHELTLKVYKVSDSFPKHELYGLTTQIRRAVSSIPTNIAEGCGKSTDSDFARYLDISFGSANELEYQILLAKDLGYLEELIYTELLSDIVGIKKCCQSLSKRLEIHQKANCLILTVAI